MATKTQATLFEHFRAVSAGKGAGVQGASASESAAAMTLPHVTAAHGAAARGAAPSSRPAANSSRAGSALSSRAPLPGGSGVGSTPSTPPAQTSSSIESTVLSIASKVFDSGVGLIPLIGGLFGLFGGGGPSVPPPLVKYTMPERQYFSGADTGNGFGPADYDQMGMPRAYNTATAGDSWQGSAATAPDGGGSTGGSPAHQITVNVQAMDARSFLDHSNDIAQAVRQAMLNLSSINDVVNEL
jgi:hypothetical protein